MEADRPLRVLLLEDDEEDWILTRDLFRRMAPGAYALDWTTDPVEVVADMVAERHDVYLLDYRLGARTGVEVLREALAAGASALAILLTGEPDGEADREALEAGVADYLEKDGLDAPTLARAIRYALAQRRHHDELEQRVADRTAELAEANQALQDADRRKNEFLAVLAHELRNPLSPLRAAAEVLHRDPSSQERAALHELIGRQVSHLSRLVDDLLDVSRITTGKIQVVRQPVALGEVLAGAVETTRPTFEERGHALGVTGTDRGVVVDADRVRLSQVFANLLLNAAKYTDPGGEVHLDVTRDGDQAVVRISDNGVGIPPEALDRVFDRFVQLGGPLDRPFGGLGVGLSLVRTLVELHGGTVQAASDGPGRGSVFTVRLPALRTAPVQVLRPSGPASSGSAVRVLVADDNADAADSLRLLLELGGHEVRTANNGLAAVEEAGRFRPAVALLDIGMPVLNGYDAARRIRTEPWGKELVLVALTGWGTTEDRQRALAAGFDHHLVKPVDFDAVEALLAGLG